MSEPIHIDRNDRPRVRIVSTSTGAYPIRVEGLGDAMVREVRINPIKPGEPITAWVEVFDVDVDLDLDPKIRLIGIADMEADAAAAQWKPMGTGRGFRLGPPLPPSPGPTPPDEGPGY